MKVAVFIDHDIICRHFVLSGALRTLSEVAELHFVFPAGGKRVTQDPASLPLNAPWSALPIDASRQQTWNWALFADQLKLRQGAQERAIRRFRWKALRWKAALLLTLAGLPIGTQLFAYILRKRLSQRPATELTTFLDKFQPDIILHPTVLAGVFINDLAAECEARGTPLVAAMNSWDNPSTKRAVVGQPTRLLVWGPQTKRHAMRFMGLPEDIVEEFGAAQFDVFREPPRTTREVLCAEHGLDPRRRILLFAGSNAQVDETTLLERLDSAIDAGKIGDVSVIYRPHPWGNGGKDGKRLATASWRHIVVDRTMRNYIAKVAAGDTSISLPDYRNTHDLLSAVDGVVSPLSTILVEGALHAKPVVAFVPASSVFASATATLPYLHFEEFFAVPDVIVSKSFEELLAGMKRIANPVTSEEIGRRLQLASEQFVSRFERPWRERIVDLLREVISHDTGVSA